MRIQSIGLVLILAGLTVNSAGCLVVAAGAGAAGTVAYMRGDLETEEPYKLDVVYAATREATKQLELSVLEGKTEKDALSAIIVARDAADKRVTIHLKARTEQTTGISIRIGTFGDQTKSQMIYNRIKENLRAMAPAAPQTAQAPSQPASPPATNPPVSPPPAPATPSPPVVQPPGQTPQGASASPSAQTVTSSPAAK
jgi:hypothetical protein